jgi:ubiquinone/menaquinone biosynthesis C-methylase UbiE
MTRLPYFDLLLDARKDGRAAAQAFDRHVHWGLWENSSAVCRTPAEFAAAAKRLDDALIERAGIVDGATVLDAGCGFGGTLEALEKRFPKARLLGVNIDERQLAVARTRTRATLLNADACKLPLASGSLDAALAVECIFHFPSRLAFLKECARTLKPGARLTLSDFVPTHPGGDAGFLGRLIERKVAQGYGDLGSGWSDGSYAELAEAAGLAIVSDEDVTERTLPTYPYLIGECKKDPQAAFLVWPTRLLYWLSRFGPVRYRIVCFEKREER